MYDYRNHLLCSKYQRGQTKDIKEIGSSRFREEQNFPCFAQQGQNRENGTLYGSGPAKNAGKTKAFRESDRAIPI